MAIVITQTCDACGNERILEKLIAHDHGGWRILNRKIVCPVCINNLFGTLNA